MTKTKQKKIKKLMNSIERNKLAIWMVVSILVLNVSFIVIM